MLEVGAGGKVLNVARNLLVKSQVFGPNQQLEKMNAVQNAMVRTLNTIKQSIPGSQLAEPYITGAGVLLIMQGTYLHMQNDYSIGPKILEVNPTYYHHNIQHIFENKSGGGGASRKW